MNWYLQLGKKSDVVINTKIEFSRNINGFRFNPDNKKEKELIKRKVKENLYLIGYGLKYIDLQDIDNIEKMELIEKNILTKDYATENKNGAIIINDEENICIRVNDEEHLKIQVFSAGLELENTLNLAIELDNKIGEILGYSISKEYGYLTADPNKCGTGLKASVAVQLSGINKTKNIKKVFYFINNLGFDLNKMETEENKKQSDIYIVSNKQTLGCTEKEIIDDLNIIIEKLIEQERIAKKFLARHSIQLEDKAYRAYGILKECKKISLEETEELLNDIKIGIDIGIFNEIKETKIRKLNLYTKPASMKKIINEKYTKMEEDIKRAEIIKQILKE